MTQQKTPAQMALWAAETRARAEGSVVRGYFLNQVLPALSTEFARLIAAGDAPVLLLPDADEFAKAYVAKIAEINNMPALV